MSNLKHKYILCPDVLELISKNEELEAQLAEIADLAIKPSTQGGWNLEAFIEKLQEIINKEKGDG